MSAAASKIAPLMRYYSYRKWVPTVPRCRVTSGNHLRYQSKILSVSPSPIPLLSPPQTAAPPKISTEFGGCCDD